MRVWGSVIANYKPQTYTKITVAFLEKTRYNKTDMNEQTDLVAQKNALRQNVLSLLPSVRNRAKKENAIAAAALSYVRENRVKTAAIYLSGKGEVSTDGLCEGLFQEGVRVYAPVVTGDGEMLFAEIRQGETFVLNRYGLREPPVTETADDFDVVFVPLVAFDKDCRRLGRGKGFYDRFLRGKHAVKIGLAFAEQETATVPCDDADEPLDFVFFS